MIKGSEMSQEIKRDYPGHPLIGVAGVVFRDDEILMIKRGSHPAFGQWSVPGGLVELGEGLTHALAREIKEETGVTASVESLVEVVQRIDRDKAEKIRYHFVILDFLCRYESGEPRADTDAAEAKWVGPEELATMKLDAKMSRVIDKARLMNTRI